jgi:hypothetical protein
LRPQQTVSFIRKQRAAAPKTYVAAGPERYQQNPGLAPDPICLTSPLLSPGADEVAIETCSFSKYAGFTGEGGVGVGVKGVEGRR